MQEQLNIAMNLQLLENQRRALQEQIDAIPRELAQKDTQTHALEEAVANAKAQIEEGRAERRTLENEIEEKKTKISKYRQQLMAVKTNKEYSALLHEIEEGNGQIRTIEDRVLEVMVKEEELAGELSEREQELVQAKKDLEHERVEGEAEQRKLQEQQSGVQAECQALRDKLDSEILNHFDKVFKLRGGVAVVGVLGESCEGCRVRIRPQALSEIRKGDRMHVCDSCKRILYIPEGAPAAAESEPGSPDGVVSG